MNRSIKSIWAIVAMSICMLAACQHDSNLPAPGAPVSNDTTNNGGDTTGNNDPVDTSICFERDILPIFRANCAVQGGCHDAASHEEGYILDSYSNIMNTGDDDGIVPFNAGASEIYESIIEDDIDKRMPYQRPALSAQQIALIRRWINEGAQNGTNCVVLCDTNNVAYSTGIAPLMQQNCIGCHNGSVASGGVNLSSYDGVRAVAMNGKLIGTVKHTIGYTPMPQNGQKLSDCKIRQIEKWIEGGALNN